MRASVEDLGRRALADLAAALDDLGVRVKRPTTRADHSANLVLDFDGNRFAVHVEAVAYATDRRIQDLLRRRKPPGTIGVLVADRITEEARRALRKAGWGWLDRRGHLMIRAPGVLLDRTLQPGAEPQRSSPIAGRAGCAVAYALLTAGDKALPVRKSAPILGVSPAAISNALGRLRENGLIDADGLPVLPELFWALAEVWAPARHWLSTVPNPRDPDMHSTDLEVAGWCLTGTEAAATWGAPVTATTGAPDLYVPGPVIVSIAVRRFGSVAPIDAQASIAVAPVPMVTSRRYRVGKSRWALAHPVAVALDLAQDVARGPEILADWNPPKGMVAGWNPRGVSSRVW